MDLESNVRTLRRQTRIAATIHIAVLLILLAGCSIAATEASGLSFLILGAASILFLWHLLAAIRYLFTDRPRVVAYFRNRGSRTAPQESSAAFRGGYHLAANLSRLDDRARQFGVAPLSSFGFGDDLLHQVPQWSSIEDGIRTLTTLIDHTDDNDTRADLSRLLAVLEKASETQSVFALIARYGADEFISGVEMDRRTGTFWT